MLILQLPRMKLFVLQEARSSEGINSYFDVLKV